MAESDPPHALAHLTGRECYDLLIAERAALVAARQGREDGLVGTITQISAAALLLIPGVLTSATKLPSLREGPILYLGMVGFLVALCAALAEQWLSGTAYRRQQEVTEAYYLKQSEKTYDERSSTLVRRAQATSLTFFAFALLFSVIGFVEIQ